MYVATDFNNTANYTITIIGDWNMTDIEVSVDVYIEENDQEFGTPGKAILGARGKFYYYLLIW